MQGDEREASSSEDEMPATERELADDAQWKLIQKNTFTRWANEHLKTCNKHIGDLDTDLGDGLRLIALVEVLSGRKFTRFTKRPVVRPQKLENVTMALNFLQKDEGIKIVTIDSGHIVDGSPKLILGLMWTLILHYSISMPMWEEDEFDEPVGREKTPKQRLLAWVQNKIPEAPITNFTRDWNDGRAIGALVDAIAPGLCPDWEDWEPKNAFENAKEAMDAAEQWLNVPQLIKPEEMTNPKIDEKCMMTYLSQFPNAKLKPGAPLRPRTNPKKVRAFGPGIEPTGNSVGAIARFTIETFSAGKGSVEVIILNPKGQQEKCEVLFNNDRNLTYSCSYTPTMEGNYKVIVKFATKEIPRSPFTVTVEGQAGDASKVTAVGPGIERTGNMVGKRAHFEVFTKKAGFGNIEIVILDPHGRKDIVKPKVTKTSEDTYLVEYMPKEEGLHSVSVFFAGSAIPKSPFGVGVAPPCNPSKVYATGRGIQPKGVRVRDVADFQVHTEGAGDGELKVHVTGPGGVEEKVIVKQIDKTNYECVYTPLKTGEYTVMITYAGANIPKSPFRVDVAKASDSKIRAYGPGLETGVVGCPCDFTVETNNETGALGKPLPKITTKWFSIEGPSQAKIDCNDNGDGSADISYYPTIPGEYAVHILCNESDIPGSPFMAQIVPATADFNPTKVKAYGPGLEKTGVEPNRWAEFTVDCREAGTAPLKITCVDAQNNPIEVQVADNRNNTYSCRYIPKNVEKHTIYVSYGGCNIPNSPFRVYVAEPSKPSKVKVYGPGLEKGVRMHEPTYFIVDCKEAGPGDVAIALTDEKGNDVPVSTTDNKDGTFTIQYEPNSVGTYTTGVFFAEQEIPSSPYKVQVEPHIDVSQVYCDGLQQKSEVGKEYDFDIITADAGGKAPTDVIIIAPSGKQVPVKIEEIPDGYIVKYTLEELGTHSADVIFNNQSIPNSPFKTEGVPKGKAPTEKPMSESAKKVKAYGPGLSKGVTGAPAEFTIDTREAGPGGLGLTIEGPAEAKIDCSDNGDGTCGVKYYPLEPGEYTINILFADEYIPKSPYKARVVPPGKENLNVSGVKTYGPGVEREGVFLESPTDFTVDARSVTPSGDGKVKAILTNPQGTKYDTIVKNHQDGTYNVSYTPFEQGVHTLDVTYDGIPVPGSPFNVNVVPGCDVTRVKAYGPGLEGGNTNIPQVFTVETRGAGQGGLGLAIEGPSEAKMTCRDNRDGSCAVEYHPTKPGDYDISVKFADEHIPGSPFHVSITDKVDAKKAKAFGPGLKPEGVRAGVPAEFTVDAREAGVGFLDVAVVGKDGKKKPGHIKPVGDGTYECSYVPEVEGPCQVEVKYGDEQVPKSPFKTKVLPKSDASKVKVVGDGVKPTGVPASLPVSFTVDTKEAGVADLGVEIQNPEGLRVTPEVLDNADGTFTVSYTPEEVGQHTVDVKFDGKPVPKSPFKVKTSPSGHPEKCKIIEGLEQTVILGEETVITINTADAGKGAITCKIRNPTGGDCDIDIEDNADGTVSIYYTPRFPGTHSIAINFGGKPIPKGEFTQEAIPREVYDERIAQQERDRLAAIEEARLAQEKLEEEKREQERLAQEKLEQERLEQERLAQEKLEQERLEQQRLAQEKLEQERLEQQRLEEERLEEERLEKERLEEERLAEEQREKERLEEEKREQERLKQLEEEQREQERLEAERLEQQRLEDEKLEKERLEQEKLEQQRLEEEKLEQQRLEEEKLQQQRLEEEQLEKQRLEEEQLEQQRLEEEQKPTVDGGDNTIVACEREAPNYSAPDISDLFAHQPPPVPEDAPTNVDEDDLVAPDSSMPDDDPNLRPVPTLEDDSSVEELSPDLMVDEDDIVPSEREIPNYSALGDLFPDVRPTSASEAGCNDPGVLATEHSEEVISAPSLLVDFKFGKSSPERGSPAPDLSCPDLNETAPVEEDLISASSAPGVHSAVPLSPGFGGPGYPGGSDQFRPVDFCIPVGPVFNSVSADIIMPSGKVAYPKIEDNKDGTVTIRYTPEEVGTHEMNVRYNNQAIQGSPFKFHVDAVSSGYVTAYGPGLSHGVSGEPCHFTINTKHAGAGGLALAVEGPSKSEIRCKDNKDGTCSVTYYPTCPGEYKIIVKFADQHISGSPFTAKITGNRQKKAQISVGSSSEVSLKVTETDISTLKSTIKSPSGREEPCILKRLANGHLGISFTPKETGQHLVNVFRDGKHIPNSPFKIHVGESELGNASKVKVHGKGLHEGMAGEKNDFVVDTKAAGYGGLSLSIEGPSKADIECEDNEDGTCKVSYKPTEPGTYIINVKFADEHVPGSPFPVHIGGESHRLTEHITSQRRATEATHVGSQCELSLKIPGTSPFDMNASVTSPSGQTELCEIKDLDDCHYSIKFVPKEMGVHTVSVKHKDLHIPGSPFQFTVGPITEGGAHKVHAGGPGLESGEVSQPADFNIYTREAGAGGLSIAVEGPSKAEIKFEDRKDGSCGVSYHVTEPGDYLVSVKFNDEHIPDSPFKVPFSPENADARKLNIIALQEKGLQVGRPAAFTVDFNGAHGTLTAYVVSPSGAEEEAIIQELDDDKHAVRFIPKENGAHYVHVRFNDTPIQGSPFRLLVGKCDADPGMVHASGEGLVNGKTDHPCRFIVDTCNAGSGALSVTIDGPSKVKLDCKELANGYGFTYVPTAPGDYLITIKYAGNYHVVGSPFKAHITGTGKANQGVVEQAQFVVNTEAKSASESKIAHLFRTPDADASKVICKGLGLKKAFVKQQAQFTVDTKDAGTNVLMVGILGPGSKLCEEICIKHQGRQQYKVDYLLKERGDYLLIVKWGDDHVPGSPYAITV
ncbi:filamin-A-like isoform X3 [Lineus longissimus]|uniref:filamin-A-like isoform X3 n=1 Tax=Lineus longissimus TaxID=88925 RepID=UPI00315D6633